MNLYLLKKFVYGDDGDENGGEHKTIAICLAQTEEYAVWKFRLMGFNNLQGALYDIEEIRPLDDVGHMFLL